MYSREKIGLRVKRVREHRHLTQMELAEGANLSVETVRKMEQGVTCPYVENLALICEFLHVSADYILFGTDEEMALSNEGEIANKKVMVAERLANDILELFALTAQGKNGTL